jgi:transcriptional regulator with XRE-family HTH domain
MASRRLVARNLKRIRLSRRLSQEALAAVADIDRTYVSGLERGVRNPTVDLLDRLAKALSIKTADFFEASTSAPPPQNLPRGRRRKAIR